MGSEYSQHSYRLCEKCFAHLDGLWGPHSIDRFASAENCQPLIAPNAGRFCSRFFHPDAEWTDALTIGWAGGNNWISPPTHAVGTAVTHLREAGVESTLICPNASWASWWHLLHACPHWAPDIIGTVRSFSARSHPLLLPIPLIGTCSTPGASSRSVARAGHERVSLDETRRPPRRAHCAPSGDAAAQQAARPPSGSAAPHPRDQPAPGRRRGRAVTGHGPPRRSGYGPAVMEPIRWIAHFATFLAESADGARSYSQTKSRVCAIKVLSLIARLPSPSKVEGVREVRSGVRCTRCVRRGQATPVFTHEIPAASALPSPPWDGGGARARGPSSPRSGAGSRHSAPLP
jgi:hypothetical protein